MTQEDMLRRCREQFSFYAAQHRAKIQPAMPDEARADTERKAAVNARMVVEIAECLETVRFPDYFVFIRDWAAGRDLLGSERAHPQMTKLTEEVGEVARAVARGDRGMLRDEIGDCFVVLTIMAAQHGLSVEDCVATAWDKVKDRTGKTVNGVFVKDGE